MRIWALKEYKNCPCPRERGRGRGDLRRRPPQCTERARARARAPLGPGSLAVARAPPLRLGPFFAYINIFRAGPTTSHDDTRPPRVPGLLYLIKPGVAAPLRAPTRARELGTAGARLGRGGARTRSVCARVHRLRPCTSRLYRPQTSRGPHRRRVRRRRVGSSKDGSPSSLRPSTYI